MSLPPTLQRPASRSASDLLFRPLDVLAEGKAQVGTRFTLDLGARGPLVITGEGADVPPLFGADAQTVSAAAETPALLPFLGDQAVLSLEGAAHHHARRLLGAVMTTPLPDVESLTNDLVDTWSVGERPALRPLLAAVALDVVVRWLIGRPDPELADAAREVLAHTSPSLQLRETPWPPLQDAQAALRQRLASVDPTPCALMTALRAAGPSTEWVLDQAVALVIAGHETTAASLGWAAVYLGSAPQASPESFTWEVLRLHPPIPFVLRTPHVDWSLGDWTVPRGTPIAVSAHLVHRDPTVWPRPEVFAPNRHGQGRPGLPHWLPFGGGARQCLGLHTALRVLASVLEVLERRVRFAPWTSPTPEPRRRNLTIGPQGSVARIVESLLPREGA